MKKSQIVPLVLGFVVTIVILILSVNLMGYVRNTNTNFYFEDDGERFLVSPQELPSYWKLADFNRTSEEGGLGWDKIYLTENYEGILPPLNRMVRTTANIFEKEEDAIIVFELFTEDTPEVLLKGCLEPFSPYTYESHEANEFQATCVIGNDLQGRDIYDYFVIARYGNVVITNSAKVMKDEVASAIELDKLGVLPLSVWIDILENTDEKIREAK
jgi:hypothetical protein